MATYGAGLGLSASQHSEIFFAVKVSGTTYALKSIDKGTAVTHTSRFAGIVRIPLDIGNS